VSPCTDSLASESGSSLSSFSSIVSEEEGGGFDSGAAGLSTIEVYVVGASSAWVVF
jgi:hypothetical protein